MLHCVPLRVRQNMLIQHSDRKVQFVQCRDKFLLALGLIVERNALRCDWTMARRHADARMSGLAKRRKLILS